MTRKMPIVTLEAVDKALASEQSGDSRTYDNEGLGSFTSWVSKFFAKYGPKIMLRSYYNICYTALRESGGVPQLSSKSLVYTFLKVAEETTGKRAQDVNYPALKGLSV